MKTRRSASPHRSGNRLCSVKPNGLFEAWRKKPASTDKTGSKLSLVGQNIGLVDTVPTQLAAKVSVLYLSNNLLTNLSGIGQFQYVQKLSLSSNKISYLEDLDALKECRSLTNLAIGDNKVTKLPYFGAYLMYRCPKLTVLDGKSVSADQYFAQSQGRDESCAAVMVSTSGRATLGAIKYQLDQLCVNELRICILTHWRALLACHNELFGKIFGESFSYFRSAHLAATTGGSKDEAGECVSVTMLLQVTLFGGVYRHLQVFGYQEHFRAVQELCFRKSELTLKALKLEQPNFYAGNAGSEAPYNNYYGQSGCDHWNSVVSQILADQQQYTFSVASECDKHAFLRAQSKGRRGGQTQYTNVHTQYTNEKVNEEIIGALNQIAFVSAKAAAAGSSDQSDSDPAGVNDRQACCGNLKGIMSIKIPEHGGGPDGGRVGDAGSPRSASSGAGADSAQNRYSSLLQQYMVEEKKATRSRSGGRDRRDDELPPPPPPAGGPGSSSRRPPRSPSKVTQGQTPVQTSTDFGIALNPNVFRGGSSGDEELPTRVGMDPYAPEIDEFRAKVAAEAEVLPVNDSSSTEGAGPVAAEHIDEAVSAIWAFTEDELRFCDRARWDLESPEREAALAADRAAIAEKTVHRASMLLLTDMNSMRREIGRLTSLLYNSDSANLYFQLVADHRALKTRCAELFAKEQLKREQCKLKLVEHERNNLVKVKETKLARWWVHEMAAVTSQIDDAQEKLDEARRGRQEAVAEVEGSYRQCEEMEAERERMLGSLAAVVGEMKALSAHLQREASPALRALIGQRQREERADRFFARLQSTESTGTEQTVFCRRLVGMQGAKLYYLSLWRRRVRRQRRIREFALTRRAERRAVLLRASFVCLFMHTNSEKRLRRASDWLVRGRKQRVFDSWRRTFGQRVCVDEYLLNRARTGTRRRLKRGIRAWICLVTEARLARAQDTKLAVLFQCYKVGQIFERWKAWTARANEAICMAPEMEAVNNARAWRYRAERVFAAWSEQADNSGGVLERAAGELVHHRNTATRSRVLAAWLLLSRVCRHYKYTARHRVISRLDAGHRDSERARRLERAAASHYRSWSCRAALVTWFKRMRRFRRLASLGARLFRSRRVRTLLGLWNTWVAAKKQVMTRMVTETLVMGTYMQSLMRKAFGGWKEYVLQTLIDRARDLKMQLQDDIEHAAWRQNPDMRFIRSLRSGHSARVPTALTSSPPESDSTPAVGTGGDLATATYYLGSSSDSESDCEGGGRVELMRSTLPGRGVTAPLGHVRSLVRRWTGFSARRQLLRKHGDLVREARLCALTKERFGSWMSAWMRTLLCKINAQRAIVVGSETPAGTAVDAPDSSAQNIALQKRLDLVKGRLEQRRHENSQLRVHSSTRQAASVDNLVLQMADADAKADALECTSLEQRLEIQQLKAQLDGADVACKKLQSETRAILIQCQVRDIPIPGDGDDCAPLVVPARVHVPLRRDDEEEADRTASELIEQLFAERAQLYADMEQLYAKAVAVQTKGYADLGETKTRQELEVAKHAQCRQRISGLDAGIADLEEQLAAGRTTLDACSKTLAQTAQKFDGDVRCLVVLHVRVSRLSVLWMIYCVAAVICVVDEGLGRSLSGDGGAGAGAAGAPRTPERGAAAAAGGA